MIHSSTKYMQQAIPYITRILKKNKYTEDKLRETLLDNEKNTDFIKFLYNELPIHLKLKIKEELFIQLYLEESKKALNNKKNRKKIFKNKES